MENAGHARTLMVDAMEYLRPWGQRGGLQIVDFENSHCWSFIIASNGQEEERDQLKAIFKDIVDCAILLDQV